ncbi:MAG: TRAP transporter large permease [Burkholderiales bacterium]
MLLVTMLVVLLVFSLLGMEIAWAIGFACFVYLAMSQFGPNPTEFVLFSQQMVVGLDAFILVAIPLFIFAGELMNVSGVTQRLVRFASALVGHFHGGLANVGVVTNFLMSGISGSALADAAATGTVLVPEMTKRKFPPAFASGVIAAAATVGPIIPPSIPLLLIASIMNLSVGQLFLAGIVPGVLMFVFMFAVTWWICRAKDYPREPRATGPERALALRDGLLPLLAPVIIVGSIVGGIATATEAAAIAVLYTVVLGVIVYRNTSMADIFEAAGRTALASSVVMLTIATSQIFAWLAVQERLGEYLTAGMLGFSGNVYVLLALANVLMLILGMFMEIVPVMFILAPILFPLFAKMGVSEVQFALVMVLNLMIGMITPPIGLNLFVLSAISGVDVMRIFKAAIPYFWALVAVLILITYIPALTLTIPNLVFGQP